MANVDSLLGDAAVREAIYRASPSLLDALDGKRKSNEDPRLAVRRYLERMRGRATPFSLQSGYVFGTTGGPTTAVELVSRSEYRRIVRLDLDAVVRLIVRHAANHARAVRWVARADALKFPDLVRLASRSEDGESVTYADVARSEALDAVLDAASTPLTLEELEIVASRFADNREQADAFIEALREHRLLVPAALPDVLAANELTCLAEIAPDTARAALHIRDRPLSEGVDTTELLQTATLEHKDLLYDVVKPAVTANVGDDVVAACKTILGVLQRVSPPRPDARMAAFVNQFRARYENRPVPLTEALDQRRGLDFPVSMEANPAPPNDLDGWKVRLLERACRDGAEEIVLRENDMPAKVQWESPVALAMGFSLAQDPLSLWDPFTTPPTAFFARATAFMPELRKASSDFIAARAALEPDVDFADISCFLPGRSAAFTQYPLLVGAEITLSAGRCRDATCFDPNELRIVVERGRPRLFSEKTGREVRVLATSAADIDRPDTTALHRFLSRLSLLDAPYHRWSWGPAAPAARLPRVRFGDHVLCSAVWHLQPEQTAALRKAHGKPSAWDAVQGLRHEIKLPRFARYHEVHDHVLPIDFDDRRSVEAWLDVLRPGVAALSEMFPVERSVVKGPEGSFHHEVIVPILRKRLAAAEVKRPSPRIVAIDETLDRVPPGRGTLFLTFTGDGNELVTTLIDVVENVVRPAMQQGEVTHWFFLPFADPSTHMRLRLFGDPKVLWGGSLLRRLTEVLDSRVSQRVLSDVSLRTYDRETHRYGGRVGLDLVEHVFHASSEAAIAMHTAMAFDVDQMGIEAVIVPYVGSLRAILSASGLSICAQQEVVDLACEDYLQQVDKNVPRQWASELFRKKREQLQALPSPEEIFGPEPAEFLRTAFVDLGVAIERGQVHQPLADLVGDCLHAHSLRLLTAWSELQHFETTAYHLLHKIIAWERARTFVKSARPDK